MKIFTEPVVLASIGGIAIQLLAFLELQSLEKNLRPDFKDIIYWIPYIIAPFISGLMGYAYFHDHPPDNNILAIHIGASAPLILRTMAGVFPRH